MFEARVVGETPAIDSKSIMGRNVQVSLSEISGDRNKYFVKLNFRISGVSGGKASTVFNGMETTRDYIYRMVRKRSQKVELIKELESADNWKVQLTVITILNRNTESTVKRKVREEVSRILEANAKKSSMDEIVSRILSTSLQKEIKKKVTKTYPVRFTEVSKIEVMKAPD
jgi:small subunit ribosomal protein S3Ae